MRISQNSQIAHNVYHQGDQNRSTHHAYHTSQDLSSVNQSRIGTSTGEKHHFNEDFQQVCKILNIDIAALQQKYDLLSSPNFRAYQDFLLEEHGNDNIARIRYEHHDKKRRTKLRQIQEFMHAMNKKSKSNLVTLSLIPKENISELKKSKLYLNQSYVARESVTAGSGTGEVKMSRQRPRTHKGSLQRDYTQQQQLQTHYTSMTHLNQGISRDPYAGNTANSGIFDLTHAQNGYHTQKTSIQDPNDQKSASIKDDFMKAFKDKTYFQKLPTSQRQRLFRLKSAKKDKKIEKNLKLKKEQHLWKAQEYNTHIDRVLQKKKMLEMEDEARREQKLEAYLERTQRLQDKRFSHNIGTMKESLSQEEVEEDSTERVIRDKLHLYEEKMHRASLRKQQALEKERDRISSQQQHLRERRNTHENQHQVREYHTLQRYCDRLSKSKKVLKRYKEEKDYIFEKKRYDESQKANQRKMRMEEQSAQYFNRVNESMTVYQQRSQALNTSEVRQEQDMSRRIKRSLRDQDQQYNMKRILMIQKQYKNQLMQCMMEKDKRYQGFQEYKRVLMGRSFVNNTSGTKSVQNISFNNMISSQ